MRKRTTATIVVQLSPETTIKLDYITQSEQGQLQLDARLTLAEFQKMTSDLFDRCRMPIEQVMKDAAVKPDAIGHVVLVGGSTRMPAVVDLVRELTGGIEPNKGVNPEEVVAVGACILAGQLKSTGWLA